MLRANTPLSFFSLPLWARLPCGGRRRRAARARPPALSLSALSALEARARETRLYRAGEESVRSQLRKSKC